MAEDSLSIDRIVEVLVELDVVAFDEPGPWPGPPGANDQICDVDLDEVWPSEGSQQPNAREDDWKWSDAPDPWGQVGDRVRDVASRGPFEPPPILDALAWYLPIHFFGGESAIYLRESALIEVAGLILQYVPESRRVDSDAVQ